MNLYGKILDLCGNNWVTQYIEDYYGDNFNHRTIDLITNTFEGHISM